MTENAIEISDDVEASVRSDVVSTAYHYWRAKAGGAMPRRADLRPAEMRAFLANIILLDVQAAPLDFTFRLVGTEICRHLERDPTGVALSSREATCEGSSIWANCAWVVNQRRPLYARTPYVGPHRDFLEAEDVICPLADRDGRVAMLFVVVDYLDF